MNGLILAWLENFDLVVFTPNGRHETHLMALEFMEISGSVSSCSDVTTSDCCARGHILTTDMVYDEDHTNLTTAAKSSIDEGSFLVKIDSDITVPRLPKQEAAKVDIFSHCAIPLLHHTHPKIHIPNTIKPGQTLPLVEMRNKCCTKKFKMSTKGVVDKH